MLVQWLWDVNFPSVSDEANIRWIGWLFVETRISAFTEKHRSSYKWQSLVNKDLQGLHKSEWLNSKEGQEHIWSMFTQCAPSSPNPNDWKRHFFKRTRKIARQCIQNSSMTGLVCKISLSWNIQITDHFPYTIQWFILGKCFTL